MQTMKTKKGFTLIELLIVIAIIGILAVAFLPTLLGAPAKGRDTSRIADLEKINKVLVNRDLEGGTLPATACVNGTSFATLITSFGGAVPVDPQPANALPTDGATTCTGQYYFKQDPSTSYNYGLYAHVELLDNANAVCASAYSGTITAPAAGSSAATWCFAILTQ